MTSLGPHGRPGKRPPGQAWGKAQLFSLAACLWESDLPSPVSLLIPEAELQASGAAGQRPAVGSPGWRPLSITDGRLRRAASSSWPPDVPHLRGCSMLSDPWDVRGWSCPSSTHPECPHSAPHFSLCVEGRLPLGMDWRRQHPGGRASVGSAMGARTESLPVGASSRCVWQVACPSQYLH